MVEKDVRVRLDAGKVALEVRNHGKGVPRQRLERFRATATGVGVGLNSMRERVNEIGGRLEIQSDEKGTLIRVAIPLATNLPETANARERSADD
jgi:signal transduction histidine kinase